MNYKTCISIERGCINYILKNIYKLISNYIKIIYKTFCQIQYKENYIKKLKQKKITKEIAAQT